MFGPAKQFTIVTVVIVTVVIITSLSPSPSPSSSEDRASWGMHIVILVPTTELIVSSMIMMMHLP